MNRTHLIISASLVILSGFVYETLLPALNYNVAKTANADVVSAPLPPRYYVDKEAPALPMLEAKSYLVADAVTGQVIFEKEADQELPIASISKLTTAVVALELKLPVGDDLYPLLLSSSNETAEAIAGMAGRKEFVKSMNDFAQGLGLSHTSYADPSGLSPSNVSSARDLFVLGQTIRESYSDLLALTRLSQKGKWRSNNLFAEQATLYFAGGKSGNTPEALGTLMSFFDLPLSHGEVRPIVVIVLGVPGEQDVKYKVTQSVVDYLRKYVYYQ